MEIKTTCPLGHTCEKIVDDHIEVCAWYTKLVGKDPQTDMPIDESRCAIAWNPIMLVEQSGTNRQVSAAVHSLRNEMVVRQDAAIALVRGMDDAKAIENR